MTKIYSSFIFFLLLPFLLFSIDRNNGENSSFLNDLVVKRLDTSLFLRKKASLKAANPFYVLTIPKSGTFLLNKLLVLLTEKNGVPVWYIFNQNAWQFANEKDPNSLIACKKIEEAFKKRSKLNEYLLAHMNFAENFRRYSKRHSEYQKIVLIRDLRDVCVSTVYYLSEEIEKVIPSASFDDKLMFVINGVRLEENKGFFDSFWQIDKFANIAAEWIKDPTITLCRFEDLIGEKGGGSLEAQQRQITEIANALDISLTSKKLDEITAQLFGVKQGLQEGVTFREGKIGSWAAHFKEEHKEVFNQKLGHVQQELGYPIF